MFLKMPNQANQNKLVAVTRLLLCDFSHFDLLTLPPQRGERLQ